MRAELLAWYDEHQRDLPWRGRGGDADRPYRVWVSEVMLQQTRVEAVRPYFARWLRRFPDVQALAAAPLGDVLKQWEGLGYYSRARNLHAAARVVAERFGGRVPDDPNEFRALPGVGRYTAGAVMSIAFGRAEPVVDGNVRRVFARLGDDPAPADADLWALAAELVPGSRPGDFNQALMELGATVCTPRSPRCGACPLRERCAAFCAGTQAERPLPRKRAAIPHERTSVAIVERNGSLLLARRPVDTRLGGMWEFPAAVRGESETSAAGAERALREGLEMTGEAGACLGAVDHVFTHVRVTYDAVHCTVNGQPRPVLYDEYRWLAPSELTDYAMPAAQKRIAVMAIAALTPGYS
jgi:A/G-specific adenine glycosylase